jgi:hypothetical protein
MLRRIAGGSGSFGSVAFLFRGAFCRADQTVLIELEEMFQLSDLVKLFEAVVEQSVAELRLGSTIFQAKPVTWEPAVRGLVFDLRREATAAHR